MGISLCTHLQGLLLGKHLGERLLHLRLGGLGFRVEQTFAEILVQFLEQYVKTKGLGCFQCPD